MADFRASLRYIAAGFIIFGAFSTLYMPNVAQLLFYAIWNHAGSILLFVFGDRMYFKFANR